MKSKPHHSFIVLALLALVTLNCELSTAFAQGTAFTYQGQINVNGAPADGSYDLTFTLYTNSSGGAVTAGPITNLATAVSNGLFTTTIDFGADAFTGSSNWVQIGVRTNGAATFSALTPLQQITPSPYAIYAPNAGLAATADSANSVAAANVSGTLQLSQLPTGLLTNAQPGVTLSGTFSGDGAGVTNVNAVALNGLKATNFWQTAGNSGTSPTNGNFLGTTDNQPLELWVGQSRALRLEPDTNNFGAPNVIGGAPNNFVDPGIYGATIAGGGVLNYTTNGYEPGPGSNHVSAIWGAIGGGRRNTVAADHSAIAGGHDNLIQPLAYDSAIGGGSFNTINNSDEESVIAGGENNTVQTNADAAAIGGGVQNSAGGFYSTIAGGGANTVQTNAYAATIGGGVQNSAAGSYSTVPGGVNNNASGDRSFAAGDGALAADYGSFVLADASGGFFSSTASNQFSVRAEGGARFVTAGAGMTLDGQAVVPSGNYVFAYSLALQPVSTPAAFQDATFNNDAQANGWAHTPGSSQYLCAQTGLYLVQYTAEASIADSMSMRGTLNSMEIPGSQAYATPANFGPTVVISKSFLASVNSGSFLTIQFTGNSPSDNLQGGGSGSFRPSISLTITRIQ
jgi:hypothetical protein